MKYRDVLRRIKPQRLLLLAALAAVLSLGHSLLAAKPASAASVPCTIDVVPVQDITGNDVPNGFHDILWQFILRSTPDNVNVIYNWIDSRECPFGNLSTVPKDGIGRIIVEPSRDMAWNRPGIGLIPPVGMRFGIPAGHRLDSYNGTLTGCGYAVVKPNPTVRPPVARWADCRNAAKIDDGGQAAINGRTMYCESLPNVPNCGNGQWPGANPYPFNGAAGHLFTRYNCPNNVNDDHPFGPFVNGDLFVVCQDPAWYTWYNQPGYWDYNNIFRDNMVTSGLIGTDPSGNVSAFNLFMDAFNTQPGDFVTAFYVTARYPTAIPPPPSGDNLSKVRPWLQVKGGDTAALGQVTGQQFNQPGSRPNGTPDREAQYIIISSLNGTALTDHKLTEPKPADQNNLATFRFCSTSSNITTGSPAQRANGSYEFGNRNNTDAQENHDCRSGLYILNLSPETLNPPAVAGLARDNVIYNTYQTYNYSDRSAPVCSQTHPYDIPLIAPPVNGNFNPGWSANQDCPTLWLLQAPSIGHTVVTSGRATLFSIFAPTLHITGDIINQYGNYASPNQVPNLGIVVNGNVVIDGNVKEIDASIYASGTISTCDATTNGPRCRNKLTVRGSMTAAGGFHFGRTFTGELGSSGLLANGQNPCNSPNSPAECVIATGQYLLYPPPGFENRYGQSVTQPYITQEQLPTIK